MGNTVEPELQYSSSYITVTKTVIRVKGKLFRRTKVFSVFPKLNINISFGEFIDNEERTIIYFREILHYVEVVLQIKDYKIDIIDASNGFYTNIWFDSEIEDKVDYVSPCLSCPSNETGKLTEIQIRHLIHTTEFHNCWLDAKKRPVFVVTPIEHTEKLSNLTDKAIHAFFNVAFEVVKHHLGTTQHIEKIILNHGKFRNKPHLHLKIFVDKSEYFKTERWKQFSKNT